jgi:hypothetical protein
VENSKAATAIIREDKLRSGQFSFTVTKKASGYPSVDEALIDLVSNMPDKWIPATNSVGEKVDQEFVFVFGKQGC